MSDDLIERLREAYGKVATWPESRMTPDAVENLGEGFIDLLKLRNLAPEAANALAAKDTALSEMRAELERARKALEPFATYASLPSFDRLPADMPLTPGSGMAARQVTVGDFRAAARALAPSIQDETDVGVRG